jgi:hypothetical protein
MNVRGRTGVDGDVKIIALSQPSTAIGSHLKAGMLEDPEKTYVAMQRFAKQVAAVTDTRSTIEELFASVFSMLSVLELYKDSQS